MHIMPSRSRACPKAKAEAKAKGQQQATQSATHKIWQVAIADFACQEGRPELVNCPTR